MDVCTVAFGVWAAVASALAWLYRRLSAREMAQIVALIRQARDSISEGGEEITPDEALKILDAVIDALSDEGEGK